MMLLIIAGIVTVVVFLVLLTLALCRVAGVADAKADMFEAMARQEAQQRSALGHQKAA